MNFNEKRHAIKSYFSNPAAFVRYCKGALREFGTNELLQLANSTGTDKGYPGHNYARVYHALLHERRDKMKTFCEIGLLRHEFQTGTRGKKNTELKYTQAPSLSMWRAYLPNTKLIGFDLQTFEVPRIPNQVIIQGDQKEREDLKKIVEEESEIDVIIDDALHASEHQQVSFSYLFPHVTPGGYYCIEDLRYQPEAYERTHIPQTLNLLKDLSVKGEWNSPVATKSEKEYIEKTSKPFIFLIV